VEEIEKSKSLFHDPKAAAPAINAQLEIAQ